MMIVDELTGDAITRQGDGGDKYTITDIALEDGDQAYLGVTDDKGNKVGEELLGIADVDSVTFIFTTTFTDRLVVKKGEESATYYFGVKICNPNTGKEDTLIIGNKDEYGVNTLTVLPKIVEGTTTNG